MPKSGNQDTRLVWSTPGLKRIVAGAAEAQNNTASKNDGGSPGPNKS